MAVKDVSVTADTLVKIVLSENQNHVPEYALMVVSVELIQMVNNIVIAQLDGLVKIVQSAQSVISNAKMVVDAFHSAEEDAVIVNLVGPVPFVLNVDVTRTVDHMELVLVVERPALANAKTIILENIAISNHVQTSATSEVIVSTANVNAIRVSLLY